MSETLSSPLDSPIADEPTPLTKEDLAALRHADDVDAHWVDGEHYLSCVKRRTYEEREANPFLEDQTYKIRVRGSVTSYEGGDQANTAFANIISRYGHGVTLDRIARVGDTVALDWVRGNNCEAIEKKGLSRDELHLVIVRASDVNARRPIKVMADVSVLPTGSLARMIRTRWDR